MNFLLNLKIAKKLLAFAGIMIVLICITGFVGFHFTTKASKNMSSMYNNRLLPIEWLNKVNTNFTKIESNLFEMNLVKSKIEINKLFEEIKALRAEDNKLMGQYAKMKLDPFETQKLAKFNDYLKDYRALQKQAIDFTNKNQQDKALAYIQDNMQVVDNVHNIVISLAKYNEDVAKKIDEQDDKDAILSASIIIITIIIALTLALILGILISNMLSKSINAVVNNLNELAKGNLTVNDINNKSQDETGILAEALNMTIKNLNNLVKTVSKSVEDISAGSEEMSAASDQTAQGAQQVSISVSQLAAGSQEQAVDVNNSLDNINQMSIAILKISDNAENVVKMADLAESNAAKGCMQAENAVGKINQIKSTSTKTSETANKLSKLSSEIEQIVDLIKSIAGQTNLLALNAAIEAARAGEHGKGFAVVADEVKKLAGQSAEATEKITKMIKEIQSETGNVVLEMDASIKEIEEGVTIIESVGLSLSEILNAAKGVSGQAEESSKVAVTLTKDSDNVVKMMENISSITEESAASSEEIASIVEEQTASLEEINASSQSLAKIAENLQKQVSVFKI